MSAICWGFVLRLGQGLIEASLTLLIGVAVAAILRRMVTPAGTRKLFGRGAKGLVRGWLAGMLLPVCSLGVIPVAREMRRSGVPTGTVLAFVLAAPLLNPISFLYGLTLAEPSTILAFSAASLLMTTLAGVLWERVFAPADDAARSEEFARLADLDPPAAQGPRRILSVLTTASKELVGRDLIFYGVGLLGSALLAAVIPFGSLQNTMKHSDPTSPLLMAAVSVPIYSSPLTGMMKIGLMFEHGNSIGAAFVLFALGIGVSIGLILWLSVEFGVGRIVLWLACYVGVILALAYICEPLLYDTAKVEVDHTHAFDDYSCPFLSGSNDLEGAARIKLAEKYGPLEQTSVYGLLGLLMLGAVAHRLDRTQRLERWLTTAPATRVAGPWWNRAVPGYVLGAVSLAGLVLFSIIGAYVFYPAPDEVLTEMSMVRAEAVVAARTGRVEESSRQLERWDLLSRKLQVGVFIRTGSLDPKAAEAADDMRERIEELRDGLRAGESRDEIAERILTLEKAYSVCRRWFDKEPKAIP